MMKTNGPSDLARLARQIREENSCGIQQAWKAAQIAMSEYDGDGLLGYLWTEADSFAVSVGDRPKWNDEWARARAAEMMVDDDIGCPICGEGDHMCDCCFVCGSAEYDCECEA